MRIKNSSVAALSARVARIRQRGLTLIETAMVLAILAIVVGGIMWVYTNADQSRKTTQALNQLATIQQSVRSLYSGQADYTGLNNGALTTTQALPASMVSGTNIRHVFNGAVTLGVVNVGGGANSGFSVAFANIPKEVCSKLLATDLGRGNYSAGVTSPTRTQPNLPFTPALAGTACAAATNTVVWWFS